MSPRPQNMLPPWLLRPARRWVHPSVRSRRLVQQHVGAIVVLVQLTVALVGMVPVFAWALPVAWPFLVPVPILTLASLFLVRAGRPEDAMRVGGLADLLYWSIVAWCSGGATSPAILLIALPAVFPILLGDRKGALAVFACALLAIAAMVGAVDSNLAPLPRPTGEALQRLQAALFLLLSGAVVGTVAQVVDFSEATQNELAEANELLGEARDRADAANEAKSAFLAAMSHEIRTPMNGVLGVAGLLLESDLTRRQREYVDTIRSSANALVDLVEDILDFSRIEAGRLRIEAAPFEPVAIIRQVADLLRVRAREKGLRLEVEIGPRVPGRLVGDGGRLRQILFNLVGNAVKYTEEGQVTVRLTCPDRDTRRARVILEVEDSGVGIPPEHLDSIFERFTQVDDDGPARAAGTGLGLSISRHLVDLMGGDLSVESTVGMGSTFRVDLELPTEATLVDDGDDDLPMLPAARVLVAEDNPVNRKIALAILDHLGCVGDAAANGELAARMAQAHDYDAVLMDCEMPVLDGFAATRRMRAAGLRIPIIAMTAHVLPESRRRCEDSGMDDFVEKPVRLEQLHRVLARWLVHGGAPP